MDFINVTDPTSFGIHFFFEGVERLELGVEVKDIANWLKDVLSEEKQSLQSIRFILCRDEYLHQINVQYLNKDTFTDVIAFSYSTEIIDGEIYISVDRIKENAAIYEARFMDELLRVMVHGVLHLCGYEDKTEEQRAAMKEKEDFYLEKVYFI